MASIPVISGLLCLILLVPDCRGILLQNVGVPSYAVQGKDAVLTCDYDLEGQALYSVKWYKNGLEFFRYLPGSAQKMTVYARPGFFVVQEQSDAHQVTLKDLTMKSTGRYRCEVSTEAPSFATVSNYGDMVVVVLPDSGPSIQGGQPRYELGDRVDVNCTSKASKPAADIFWFINGEPADESLIHAYPIQNTSRDLHTSTVGLRFKVEPEHFSERGDMKLKCTATIASIYWKSNEKSAENIKQKRDFQSLYEAPPDSSGLSSTFGFNHAVSKFGSSSSLPVKILTFWRQTIIVMFIALLFQ